MHGACRGYRSDEALLAALSKAQREADALERKHARMKARLDALVAANKARRELAAARNLIVVPRVGETEVCSEQT